MILTTSVKRLSMLALSCMFCLMSFAQSTVTGNVKDNAGEPIVGASVLIKGTSTGTVTDINGNFTIQKANPSDVLVISSIGFTSKNVKVGNQTKLNVSLSEDMANLEEVVVIGYGTMKRRDLTGSVASVTGDKVAANPVANVAQALQGQLPGVTVTSQDGRPGASMSIRVRGGGSITQSNDPLFIVDGVQVSTIDDIPADNIESIDVLKDAASTAIYGARGANGVILVTTKGGKEGRAQVKYNVYYQAKKIPELYDVQNAYDYVYNNWTYATAYGDTYGEGVAKYFGLGSANGNHINDYKNMSAHNYQNDIMKTASSWNHDLSISGGTAKTKFYAAVNYMNDDGIRINSGFKRWGANVKVDQKINKNLSFTTDLRYSELEFRGAGFGYATTAYKYRPIDTPLGVDDPTLLGMGSASVDPLYDVNLLVNNYDYIRSMYRIRSNNTLTWNVVKGLVAKTELSLSRNWSESKDWDAGLENGYSKATLNKGNGYGVRWATTLNYEVQGLPEAHSLSFLAGNEVLASKSNSSEFIGYDYIEGWTMDQAFGQISNTHKNVNPNIPDSFTSTVGTPSHTTSWFGRANYSYLGRYLLTATFRADGSSKFAPNHHWGYFPAAALAWRISDEPFMKSTEGWLDNLKLRLSFGTSGSDNIDASLWKETWQVKEITVDGEKVTTYVPGSMQANPDLKWETTISRNLGLDFTLLRNWVRGSLDIYWNTTKNILMKVPVNASSGYSYQFQNVGKTSNKGVELALGFDIIRKKDFNLGVNMTYNYNSNNVDEVNPNANANTATGWASSMILPTYDYIIREGEPVGTINGYKSLGYFTPEDFDYDPTTKKYTLKPSVTGVATQGNYPDPLLALAADGKTFPGAPKFEAEQNENGEWVAKEQVIGHTMPQHTGGININGRWKGLDFAVGLTYQLDGKVYNANALASCLKGDKDTGLGSNRLSYTADTYKYYSIDASGDLKFETEPSALNALNAGTKYATFYSEFGIVSSEFIENAAYLRLNTITLGYTLPKKLTNRIGISTLRFYVTGGNLFCITGYSGLDPDVNTRSSVNGFPTPAYDYQAYPKARTFTFGVNVGF